jgi:hypothetical protein
MPKYIINKLSRYTSTPYSGPTCDQAGVEKGVVYTDYGMALRDVEALNDFNDVGFKVVDFQEVLDKENLEDLERQVLDLDGRAYARNYEYLKQAQWYVVSDRGRCEPIAAGPFATKDEAHLHLWADSDLIRSVRNRDLPIYIANHGDLRPDAIRKN